MSDARPRLADQAERTRFTDELDHNFTVTAPAGVGKTTAIVSRVVNLAKGDDMRETPALPRLAVVTYTRKAADEMRQRTAQELHKKQQEDHLSPEVFTRFNQAFFGTIHSFCLELLRTFGPLAGLAPQFEQAGNLDALWRDFIRGKDNILGCLDNGPRESLERHGSIGALLSLVQKFGTQIPTPPPPGPAPMVDLAPVIKHEPQTKHKGALAGIAEAKRLALQWEQAYASAEPCPPIDFTRGGKDFQTDWDLAWAPLKRWLGDAYLYVAAELAREFRAFRVARGEINFDDQIALAAELLNHPAAGPAIREQERLIILDEAQDTDPLQFAVLLNVAGSQWTPGQPFAESIGPPPGRFCMVGDPQQSIYSARADLPTYRAIHEGLVDQGTADALSFTVTMRCDAQIVDAVNQFFPRILRREEEPGQQAAFVPLHARPNAGPGRFERVTLEPAIDPEEADAGRKDSLHQEAAAIARWLRDTGREGLDVDDWSEVAILAPRNDWAESLNRAIERVHLPVQSHSRKLKRAGDPIYAWTTALIRVLAHPEDDLETVGVLREIYSLPDGTIATVKAALHTFTSATPEHHEQFEGDAPVQAVIDALLALQALQREVHDMALGDAFRVICQQTHLPERLASLPELEPARIGLTLKRLQASALQAEERGDDLVGWSRQIISSLAEDLESDDPTPGHIQLLSCHKSKGLQWNVVITPFFHYAISRRAQSFPRYYPATRHDPEFVAYDKSCDVERSRQTDQAFREETERLAYVTWTRARRRVIAIDGAAFYKKPGPSGSWTDLCLTSGDAPNAQAWVNLPEFTSGALQSKTDSPTPPKKQPAPALQFFTTPELATSEVKAATQSFPQRILPSSLADHHAAKPDEPTGHARDESDWQSEPGYPETQDGSSALGGADYGNWWHNSMENGPWGEPIEAWADYQTSVVPHAPNPERGAQEFAALLATPEFLWLNDTQRQVRAEAALFWPEHAQAPDGLELGLEGAANAQFAYDGFIDLLAYDAERDAWRIVDWKTDRIFKNPAKELRACYGPQLAAYVTALSQMFGRPVEGYLYSTRAAQWIKL
ncbi:UvrD-helicase domain-containing protein [Cerasicoccus maritimus]|uniref:UvrD-helicase domain-containing protein n=1 Tax=Cerasicoccus maritimus TaxID=490089 RepID=UPI00285283BD|nr:UvrD-helicase domain-containing protein [Cerasicoccus maritimus]